MKANPDVTISVSGGGSGNGVKAMIDGTTDIANASRFVKDKEVKAAVENGVTPVAHAVAYDCIIPVLHPSNPIADLSLEQLKAIYTGQVENWKEVGGPDKPIVVVSRDTSSGTYEVWEKKVLNKENVTPGADLAASNGAVVQAVAKNEYAIGYIGIGYMENSVKDLTVGGIKGTPQGALDGSFPISRALFMFTNGWPSGDVAKFLQFVKHPETGQKLVLDAGFVPLY